MASSGSPSGAHVPAMKPQSNGYTTPRESGREISNTPSRGSYSSFTREPRGDSTTTRKAPAPSRAASSWSACTTVPWCSPSLGVAMSPEGERVG